MVRPEDLQAAQLICFISLLKRQGGSLSLCKTERALVRVQYVQQMEIREQRLQVEHLK